MPKDPEQSADDVNEHSFLKLAEAIGAVFRLTDAQEGRIIYISPGCEKIWGRSSAALGESAGSWTDTVHPEDRDRMREATLGIGQCGGYEEEYRIHRPDGSIRWVHDRALPIRDDSGEIQRIASITEDVTDRKLLQKEVIEINDRERSRLGQDLHDGICQQLVSIAFTIDLLRRDLISLSPGQAARAAKITTLLDSAITQARSLSQALCPVNLAGDGLAVALCGLAGSVGRASGVACGADCSEDVFIHDYAVATHLYRIAQEAVQTALKHNQPTEINIRLSQAGDNIHLGVSDNGRRGDAGTAGDFGVGLSIIKFRAHMAGGRLQTQRTPEGGMEISCVFPQKAARPPQARGDYQMQGAGA